MLVPTGSSKLTALHSELYSTVDIIVCVCVFFLEISALDGNMV